MVNEAKESFMENVKERLSSPFYGTFIISWIIWNWKVWYITFFIDSDLLLKQKSILKIDYITSIYSWGSVWSSIYSLCHLVVLPLLSTWFFIYIFSKITCSFYKKSLETENENKLAKNKKDKEFLESIGDKLEAEKNILIKKAEVKKEKIKSDKSQEEIWLEEYAVFRKMNISHLFTHIVDSIYENGGNIELRHKGFKIPQPILIYAHTNGLVTYDKIESKIELTEKGKFFVKQFSING